MRYGFPLLPLLLILQWAVPVHAQKSFKPTQITGEIDEDVQFNSKDRPYLFLDIPELVASTTPPRPQARIEPTLGTSRETYQITDVGTGAAFQPAEVNTLVGGIALFGNYKIGTTYRVTILREIPCYNFADGTRLGEITAGNAGSVTWTLTANTGLDRKRVVELTPASLMNTKAEGRSSSFGFNFKLGYTNFIGKNSYVDFAADGDVSPQKDLSFNQIEGHINYGYRIRKGTIKLEFQNSLESSQDGDQINYVLGGQGVFLPPLAVSWFSKRFAWDPTVKVGYGLAKQVARGVKDQDTANRLTYDLHWVIPILDIYAFSFEGSGILELIKPVTGRRFHDKTSIGFLMLLHEKDQTKLETVFKYVRGEAPPAFNFNQSVLLGLLLQLQ